jgi:hypothetical protein
MKLSGIVRKLSWIELAQVMHQELPPANIAFDASDKNKPLVPQYSDKVFQIHYLPSFANLTSETLLGAILSSSLCNFILHLEHRCTPSLHTCTIPRIHV